MSIAGNAMGFDILLLLAAHVMEVEAETDIVTGIVVHVKGLDT